MRGPGYRISGEIRRTWRCPSCGREQKATGQVTTIACECAADTWMQIVGERLSSPRPIQRPTDIEKRPSDFGIEAPPPSPARTTSTIIKPAISPEPETATDVQKSPESEKLQSSSSERPNVDDNWDGEIV